MNFQALSSLEILCISCENPPFALNKAEIRNISYFIRKTFENNELISLKILWENPEFNQIDFEFFDEPEKLKLNSLKTFKFIYKSKEILKKPELLQQKILNNLSHLKNLENLEFTVFCKNYLEIKLLEEKIARKNIRKLKFFLSNLENPLKNSQITLENPIENPLEISPIPTENFDKIISENTLKKSVIPMILEEFSGVIEEKTEEKISDFIKKNYKIKVLKLFFKDKSYRKVFLSIRSLFFLRKLRISFEENVGFTDENLLEILNIFFSTSFEPLKDLISVEFLIYK